MKYPQQKVTIDIPKWLKPTERKAFAQEVIDFIRARTKSGIGVSETTDEAKNKKFPKYSKEYLKKKGSSLVDLTLKGDMLDAIKQLRDRAGKITIGIKTDKQNSKAHGHQTGNVGKVRKFLGISQADLRRLIKEFAGDTEERQIEEIASKTKFEKL